MTKTELIQGVQERLNCTKKDAELAVNTVFEVLTDALVHDEKVAISKFGSFEVRQRNEKLCKNPQTQELCCSSLFCCCLQGKQDAEGRCESEVIKHKGFSKQGRE